MIQPGGNFETFREAPVNHPVVRVAMDLNNYSLNSKGASASASSEFSANWPASAVVNGDLTHINAGAPLVADNGLGQAVWQGNIVSGALGVLPTPEELTIDLGQDRLINRLTFIFWPSETKNDNLGSIAPKDFLIETATDDTGFGDGGFGDGPFGGTGFVAATDLVDKNSEVGKPATTISGGQVTGNTSDYNVFESTSLITARYIRITITKLQAVGVRSRIVEILATRAVDLTVDVTAIGRARRKDFALNHRLSTEVNLTLRNFDRKYSPDHVPSPAEEDDDFFNEELRPSLEIRVFAGFNNIYSQMFRGYIDRFNPDAVNRLVKIKARDYIKYFIKNPISTKLKSNISLEAAAEYVGNLKNFPSNLMILDTTTIEVAFFMPNQKTVFDIMQELGDTTGDSDVYMDEFGRFNFRSYLNVISHIFTWAGAATFQAGTNDGTDSTTNPGQIILDKSGPDYLAEGNWFSTLSEVLDGKVQFGKFEVSEQTNFATSVDYFTRVTNDGGATFTPWRRILSGENITKMNPFDQLQVWARLRSSDVAETPSISSITIHYKSRGGSAKVSPTADFSVLYNSTMRGLQQVISDEVGGDNYMVTKSTVKSKPFFLSAGSEDAWIATVGNEEVTGSNPLILPLGDTQFNIDFGGKQYDTPQTVVAVAGTAVFTTAITNHPTNPVLTISVTQAGTITSLKITGVPFLQTGSVLAVSLAEQEVIDNFGELDDTLENDYIDNVDLAQDIADNRIAMFSSPINYLQEVLMDFSPNLQINDRGYVRELNGDVDADYYVLGATDDISVGADGSAMADTKLEMIKITRESQIPQPAYWGSGGVYYFDNFRFGGIATL